MKRVILRQMLVAVCAVATQASAQEWPQWRGPQRDGVLASFKSPAVWPEQLQRQWKVRVGSGHWHQQHVVLL